MRLLIILLSIVTLTVATNQMVLAQSDGDDPWANPFDLEPDGDNPYGNDPAPDDNPYADPAPEPEPVQPAPQPEPAPPVPTRDPLPTTPTTEDVPPAPTRDPLPTTPTTEDVPPAPTRDPIKTIPEPAPMPETVPTPPSTPTTDTEPDPVPPEEVPLPTEPLPTEVPSAEETTPPADTPPVEDVPAPATDSSADDDPYANPFDNEIPEGENADDYADPYADEKPANSGNSGGGGGGKGKDTSAGADDNPYAGMDEGDLPPLIDETGDAPDKNKKALVMDGIYEETISKERQVLKYDHLREADIFWRKRIWRVIDTEQKMNQSFAYPEQPLIDILVDIIREHNVKDLFMTDEFKDYVTLDEVEKGMNLVDTILVTDPVTGEEFRKVVKNDFNMMDVKKFRLKEDWVFDEETSQMIVRIIAIAPIKDRYNDMGGYMGAYALFWAYYPSIREHLVNYQVFNTGNDAQRLSWEDLLNMRYFGSYIMKESNLQNRRIRDYAQGKDALLESEKVKNEIFEMEQNLWSY